MCIVFFYFYKEKSSTQQDMRSDDNDVAVWIMLYVPVSGVSVASNLGWLYELCFHQCVVAVVTAPLQQNSS